MDKVAFFILNVIINSFLAFVTVSFLIETLIFIFRISQGRTAAMLRMIPFIKLPLDLVLYDFSRWSYMLGENPTLYQGTRTLSIFSTVHSEWFFSPLRSGIQLTLPGGMTFTLADLIAYKIEPLYLKVFSLGFLVFTFLLLIRRIINYVSSMKMLNVLTQNSEPLNKILSNIGLAASILKRRVTILTLPHLKGSPFVAGLFSPTIYLPKDLNLSTSEYEAVIAHEIEHVRYKDNMTRLVLDCIKTFFWWVPTNWLLKRIVEGQEIACDLKVKKYGIDPVDVATALCKTIKCSLSSPECVFVQHLTKNSVLKRVDILLKPAKQRSEGFYTALSCFAITLALCLILLGRFWIF